jgi:hypothetical protein
MHTYQSIGSISTHNILICSHNDFSNNSGQGHVVPAKMHELPIQRQRRQASAEAYQNQYTKGKERQRPIQAHLQQPGTQGRVSSENASAPSQRSESHQQNSYTGGGGSPRTLKKLVHKAPPVVRHEIQRPSSSTTTTQQESHQPSFVRTLFNAAKQELVTDSVKVTKRVVDAGFNSMSSEVQNLTQ